MRLLEPRGILNAVRQFNSSAWLVFWTLTLAYFLSYFFRSANAVIAPELSSELRLSSGDLGLMTSLFYLSFAGSQIPIGWALDTYGVRLVQPALLSVAVLGSLLFSISSNLATAGLARALLGVGLAGCLMAAFKAFAQWFPPERQATITGYLMALGVLGALGASTPLALISNQTGWRGVFMYGAALTVIAAALIALLVRDGTAQAGSPRAEPSRATSPTSSFHFLEPNLLRIACVNFFGAGSLLSIQTLWGGKYLFDFYGLTKPQVGELLTVLNLGVLIGYGAIGWLADRFGLMKVVLSGVAAFVMCLCSLAFSVPLSLIGVVYFAFGVFGTSNLLLLTHARRLYPLTLTGRATTFVNMFGIGGTFVLQALIGVIVGAFPIGGYAISFALLALGMGATLLLYAPVARKLESPRAG